MGDKCQYNHPKAEISKTDCPPLSQPLPRQVTKTESAQAHNMEESESLQVWGFHPSKSNGLTKAPFIECKGTFNDRELGSPGQGNSVHDGTFLFTRYHTEAP